MNECTKKISTSSQEALVEEPPNDGLNGGPVKPLDGGWGWVVCLACFIGNLTDKIIAIITWNILRNNMKGHLKGNFVADGLVYSFGVFIKPLSEHFKVPISQVSLVGSVTGMMAFALGPLSSFLVNRFGARKICMAGGVICGLGFGLCLLATNLLELAVFYGLIAGSGLGLMYIPTIVSVNYYFQKKRSVANGLSLSGSCIGGLVLAPTIDFVIQKYGWQMAIIAMTGLSSLIVSEGALLRNRKQPANKLGNVSNDMENGKRNVEIVNLEGSIMIPKKRKSSTDVQGMRTGNIFLVSAIVNAVNNNNNFLPTIPLKPEERGPENGVDITLKHSKDGSYFSRLLKLTVKALNLKWFTDPVFLLMFAKVFLSTMGEYIPHAYLPLYVHDVAQEVDKDGNVIHTSSGQEAFLISLINLGNMAGRILIGAVSDLPWISNVAVFNATTLMSAFAMAAFAFVSNYWAFCIVSAIYGFSVSCVSSQISVVMADLFGINALCSTFGLISLFRGVAFSLAWPLGGIVYETFTSKTSIFILGSAELLLSAIVGIAMHLTHTYKIRKRLAYANH